MGENFNPDIRYPEGEYPEGFAGARVDKRDVHKSGDEAVKRLRKRRVQLAKKFDAAASARVAADAAKRIAERLGK